jgi:heme exporter protein B
MSGPGFLRSSWIVAAKDLRMESRTWETVTAGGVLALVVLLIFNFAFSFDTLRELGPPRLVPGVLWTMLVFAAVVTFTRSMELERRRDTLAAMFMAPVDRSALYCGKLLANLAKLALLIVILLPLTAVLFDYPLLPVLFPMLLIVGLHGIGLTELGTLFAGVSVRLGRGEALVATLLFPAASPMVISAVRCTGAALAGEPLSNVKTWLLAAVGFDILYLVVALMTFEFVLEE